MSDYRQMIIWQKAMELVKVVYIITKLYPKDELFGLTSQTRRSAVSIPSNIAEGKMRQNDKEFKRFLLIAYASGAELETQLEIAYMLEYLDSRAYQEVAGKSHEIMKILNTLINKLKADC